jgi:hypothetical protein
MPTIFEIENTSAEESVEVTLRGSPDAVIKALVNGMPREALKQFSDALQVELDRRSVEAQTETNSNG